jgi:hypothetical protein
MCRRWSRDWTNRRVEMLTQGVRVVSEKCDKTCFTDHVFKEKRLHILHRLFFTDHMDAPGWLASRSCSHPIMASSPTQCLMWEVYRYKSYETSPKLIFFFNGSTALVGLGRFLFQFPNLHTGGKTPWTGDQLVARPLPKHSKTHIHTIKHPCPQGGIRTRNHGLRAMEDCSWLRPLGYRDRP